MKLVGGFLARSALSLTAWRRNLRQPFDEFFAESMLFINAILQDMDQVVPAEIELARRALHPVGVVGPPRSLTTPGRGAKGSARR